MNWRPTQRSSKRSYTRSLTKAVMRDNCGERPRWVVCGHSLGQILLSLVRLDFLVAAAY
jgi:hypothetical protein